MNDRAKENFFTAVRLVLAIAIAFYWAAKLFLTAGVSATILLLVAVFITLISVKELFREEKRLWFVLLDIPVFILMMYFSKGALILCGFVLAYELLSCFKPSFIWYLAPIPFAIIPSLVGVPIQFMVASFLAVIYIQNDLINVPYRKQMIDSTIYEQNLKKDIDRKDIETKVQLEKNMLVAENRILEERAQLSQTLHDKLGHNINGSIYQLEAAKVLIDNDPSRSKEMIGGVTDQLRSGMDEIRAILRKERPEKKKLAMLRLYDLCEDCNSKGVEANLTTEGDTGLITDMQWETILDNAFEAVSNSMKYAGCKHIDISILVLNKMIRCTIKDDGKGCKKLVDGMGIAGMRQRMRDIRGILNFDTECGFTINMLIPMEGEVNG